MSNTQLAAQLLREYGAAIRGDWGTIDGRCVRDDLDALADLAEDMAPAERKWRDYLGICPNGGGHWTYHCGDHDCSGDGA